LNEALASQSLEAEGRWVACPYCEAPCLEKELLPGQELICSRCDTTVMIHIAKRSLQPPFALSLTGLVLLLLANTTPILTFDVVGRSQSDYMITGIIELCRQGYFLIGLLVFFCGIIAPTVFLSCAFYLGFAIVLNLRPPGLKLVSTIAHAVRPWNLIPVYSVATVVAVVKLKMLGSVAWQPGARYVLGVAVMSILCEQISNRQIALEHLKKMGVMKKE